MRILDLKALTKFVTGYHRAASFSQIDSGSLDYGTLLQAQVRRRLAVLQRTGTANCISIARGHVDRVISRLPLVPADALRKTLVFGLRIAAADEVVVLTLPVENERRASLLDGSVRLLLRALVPRLASASIQAVRHGPVGSRVGVHTVRVVGEELLLVLNVNI